ncbi:MAG: hypothetical protein IPM82_26175 [Saprospiraceae bacterium]|nr:hypothetical protein [Saprospiraceae bacterium]
MGLRTFGLEATDAERRSCLPPLASSRQGKPLNWHLPDGDGDYHFEGTVQADKFSPLLFRRRPPTFSRKNIADSTLTGAFFSGKHYVPLGRGGGTPSSSWQMPTR